MKKSTYKNATVGLVCTVVSENSFYGASIQVDGVEMMTTKAGLRACRKLAEGLQSGEVTGKMGTALARYYREQVKDTEYGKRLNGSSIL